MRETAPHAGSFERALRTLLGDAVERDGRDGSEKGLTLCAPRWVLERVSSESGAPIVSYQAVPTVTTDSFVVTGVDALEREGGLGLLTAVNVITGRCVELTACHADVPPNRWPDLTLALAYGLGSPVSVAIEMIGATDAG